MPDLNLDLDYFSHPKTKRLVGLLGRGAEVLPVKLWSYCGKFHAEDGRLSDYTVQEIESIAEWWGKPGECVAALTKVRFLHTEPDGFQVHQWREHQGHIAAFHGRAKAAAQARWDKARVECLKHATSNANGEAKQSPIPTILTVPKKPPYPLFDHLIPPALDSPEFRESWGEWCEHRHERGPKLTELAARKLLKKLERIGVPRGVAAIEHSIANSYQGIFEANGVKPKASPKGEWSKAPYCPG